ncbi:MAG: hypothetical protein ACXWXZ_09020 [Candidatus Binatia bacterium]
MSANASCKVNADSLLQSNGSFTALHGEPELSEALERLAFDKLALSPPKGTF